MNLLVASDLDGTLLTHAKTISPKNRQAIKLLRESGSDITIATGRSIESARKYVKAVGVTLPVIVYNGVVIYDYETEKIIWNDNLTEKAFDYVKLIKEKFPQIGIEILRSDTIYLVADNEHVRDHIGIENLSFKECELEQVPKGWFKVLMALDEDLIPVVNQFVNEQNFSDVYCVQTSRNYFEMLPIGSSKGNALKMLCERLNIDTDNTAAIGDYNNDCEMIKIAGVGAAMDNAPDSVKQYADIVVADSEDDGFSEFIDYLLNK